MLRGGIDATDTDFKFSTNLLRLGAEGRRLPDTKRIVHKFRLFMQARVHKTKRQERLRGKAKITQRGHVI